MKNTRKHKRNSQIWKVGVPLALLVGLPWTASAAPDPSTLNIKGMPDSGRILNELEPERRITPQQAKPQIDTNIPAVEQGSKELRARIDRIDYLCSELDVGKVLKDEMQPYLGKEMDFEEMQELAQKVTASLRRKGY